MIKKTTKKVVKEVEEIDSEVIICDVCKKPLHYDNDCFTGKYAVYYRIRTGHHDWGSDSCESVEYHDACCDECLARLSQKWINDEEVQSSHTAYFEVEKETHVLKGEIPV